MNAKSIYTNEGMVVLKGSSAPFHSNKAQSKKPKEKRDALLQKGIIAQNNDRMEFLVDHLFSSPSAASGFLVLGSSNGQLDWKTPEGISFFKYQNNRIEQT